MKTRMFGCCMMLITGFTAYSQFQLSGKITDPQGKALSGVSVSIQGTELWTSSDPDGNYRFNKLPDGVYLLRYSLHAFESLESQIQMQGANQTRDVSLNPATQMIEEVFVSATRAGNNTPTTYTNLSREQLQQFNYGQDIPYLLELTPSAVATSDAGAGVGYTYLRIRGVDPTRTNVTVNGIPFNDSESHSVYWVDMPDLAGSTDNIQIQRGVGTSTNGAAAFGASINIQTDKVNPKAYVHLDQSYGSFNTWKSSARAGTGLLHNKFSMDMRLSGIGSDGYIDRASSNLRSYYITGVYSGKKALLRATQFSGREVTYQSWYGSPWAAVYGTEEDKIAYADRNWLNDADRDNLLSSGRSYNFYRYDNEVDDYTQTHNQLMYTYTFHSRMKLNAALHYTKGKGFYEQYRTGQDFTDYNLDSLFIGGDTITQTDLIRRRWLDNDFYGLVASWDFDNKKGLSIVSGGAFNRYEGRHYGEVIWARFASNSEIREPYYDNNATKSDGNIYTKINFSKKKWNVFADLQLRNISYRYLGVDQVNNEIVQQDQQVQFTFFNPKAGLLYRINGAHALYASFARANREPIRDDFRSSIASRRPKNESLNNIEAGYRMLTYRFQFNTNIYFMDYTNQLILTGKINDVGDYTRTNAAKSYRAGIETEFAWKIHKTFTMSGNLSLSQNKIKAFNEYIFNYDSYTEDSISHKQTALAFTPNAIGSLVLQWEPMKGFKTMLSTKFVGKQYLDNTQNESRSMAAYHFTNVNMSYTIKDKIGKELIVGFVINNVFNQLFSSNGYTWGYLAGGSRTDENFYYPQAGINWMGRIQLIF